ncbi:MAG: rhamnogalacturonan acetylesterase [Prevotellaceae bacterium]|jgi:lysophospholipase L1-like esterase|nr:rhamnogalacturonan acetylesterase [Prevotellaceae bacterium]
MKKLIFSFVAVALLSTLVSMDKKPVRIFLAGDSTMADKEQRAYPETGWGQVLPSYFDNNVVIENHARNGRSTRTFISEGRWDFMLNRVAKGDFVVVQFGHNDQSKNKLDRYTTPEDFKRNFERFVDDVRSKGAVPILCTPVERRKFDKDSNFVDQHGNYPNLIRQVAKEKQVYLIDMQHTSMDFLIGAGNEGSKQYFLHIGAGISEKYPDGKVDNTHFKPEGAMQMARLFVEGLQQLGISELTGHLKPASKVTLTYTTPLKEIEKLQNTINHGLDEGKTR